MSIKPRNYPQERVKFQIKSFMVEVKDIHEREWTESDVSTLISFGLTPQNRILDLGCGSGRHCLELKRRGFPNVIGLDIDILLFQLLSNRKLVIFSQRD